MSDKKRKQFNQTAASPELMELCRFEHPGYPLGVKDFEINTTQTNPWQNQVHEEMIIMLVKTGDISMQVDQNSIILRKDQGIWINQNAAWSINPADGDKYMVSVMAFHPTLLFGYVDDYLSNQYLHPIVTSPAYRYLILDPEDIMIADLLRSARKAVKAEMTRTRCADKSAVFARELEIKSIILHFWYLLVSYVNHNSNDMIRQNSNSYDDRRIYTALQYIAIHYAETMSLTDIADSMHLSTSECCRCFKRTLGVTPFEYLMKYRIFEAVRKIQKKEAASETISDLATSVGFNNASYFNKIFKKYINCTPLQYKRKVPVNNVIQSTLDMLP